MSKNDMRIYQSGDQSGEAIGQADLDWKREVLATFQEYNIGNITLLELQTRFCEIATAMTSEEDQVACELMHFIDKLLVDYHDLLNSVTSGKGKQKK